MVRARTGSSREARAAEMRRAIEAFEASGSGAAAFCRERGVPMSTFHYWRRRLAAKSSFVEVELIDGRTKAAPVIEIAAPNGVVVRLRLDADEDLIRRVLRATAPC